MRNLFWLIVVLVVAFGGCKHSVNIGLLPESPQQPEARAAMVPDESVEPVSVEFHADTAFSRDERLQIEAAAALWKVQTGGLANISVTYDLDFGSTASVVSHYTSGHDILKRMESWMPEITAKDRELFSGRFPSPVTLGEIVPSADMGMGIHHSPRVPITMILVSDRLHLHKAWLQVCAHEFGHVLGIYHDADNQSAVMWHASIPMNPVCLKRSDVLAFCSANECGTVPMYYCKD